MNYEYLRLTELVKKLNYSASTLNIYLSRAEFEEFRQGGKYRTKYKYCAELVRRLNCVAGRKKETWIKKLLST